jgi:uncharacterized membrane protein YgdD (TMEM256/DUF423 family)
LQRLFFGLGSSGGFLAVALGAFAAHGLKDSLPADRLAVFETAVRYHMFHSLALLATAWAASRWHSVAIRTAGWLFVAGIVIFSGSLYVLALSGVRAWGAVTPLGGFAFLGGWALLGWGSWKSKSEDEPPP